MDNRPSPELPRIAAFGAAIQGARDEQQDAFRLHYVEQEGCWLLVLADGMGGHACGALASRVAADAFVQAFSALTAAGSPLEERLDNSLAAANDAIAEMLEEQQGAAEGMGTTLVGAYLSPESVSWISVGDSPLWLYREGRMARLNDDHSLRQLGVGSHQSNMLQSAVVGHEIPLIDRHPEPLDLLKDDIILLSSDGILTLDESQIASTVQSANTSEPELIAWLLLHAVEDRAKSHQDNCTLIVCKPAATEERAGRLPTKENGSPLQWGLIFLCLFVVLALAAGLAYFFKVS